MTRLNSFGVAGMARAASDAWGDENAVAAFIEYVRIATVHPDPDCVPAAAFIGRLACALGLGFRSFSLGGGKPIAVVTLPGRDAALPSVLLNSHMDVVAAVRERWSVDPFGGAVVDVGGVPVLYGRGTQDCKSVGLQHVFAMARLRARGVVPLRAVHASFMPDEVWRRGVGALLRAPAAPPPPWHSRSLGALTAWSALF